MNGRPPCYVQGAALVAGLPAAYLARVLRRHLHADMRRDGLNGQAAEQVAEVYRAVERAAAAFQAARGTAVPAPAAPPAASSVMDTTAAAAALDISPRAVRKRLAAGTLPGRKRGGAWQVDADAVAAIAADER